MTTASQQLPGDSWAACSSLLGLTMSHARQLLAQHIADHKSCSQKHARSHICLACLQQMSGWPTALGTRYSISWRQPVVPRRCGRAFTLPWTGQGPFRALVWAIPLSCTAPGAFTDVHLRCLLARLDAAAWYHEHAHAAPWRSTCSTCACHGSAQLYQCESCNATTLPSCLC